MSFSPSSREIWRNTPTVFSNRRSEADSRNVSFLLFSIVFHKEFKLICTYMTSHSFTKIPR